MAITPTNLPAISNGQAGAIAIYNTAFDALDDLTTIFNTWQSTDRAVKTGALVFNVKDYGAVGDGTADDTTAIQAAITAAAVAGGVVYLPPGTYKITSSLTPKSGVTLLSHGATITCSGTFPAINGTTTAFTGFTLDGLTFVGTVNETPSNPKRGRTTSGAGMSAAIWLSGDLDVSNPGNAVMTNFTMRNCAVRNCSSLPILIRGVRGVVRVVDNEFTNNMDVGFTFNEEVIFSGNHVVMSADNGVSISRGNSKITCTGNTFENCCYWGIWVSGFSADVGPTDFAVTGNSIKNVGYGGIIADAAPTGGVISGNSIEGQYHRGPSDATTDSYGSGVYVGGIPAGSGSPTQLAQNILVAHNQIRAMPRAGVIINGAKSGKISGNLICDIGTEFLADGTTSIASSDTNTNVGILVLNSTTSLNLTFDNNMVIDERVTPFCNWSIVPIIAPTTSNYLMNTHQGLRNTYNLQEQTAAGAGARTFRDVVSFTLNSKHVGGATSGSNAGSGTVAGFDLNGAAASTRPLRWMTAAVARWHLQANNTAESGSAAGSDLELTSRDDAGAALFTVMRVTRALGTWAFLRGAAWSRNTQSLASNGAVTFDAATGNVQNVGMAANATSSSITNAVTGQELTIVWAQDGTGGRTYVWPANCKFAGGAAPNNTTASTWTSATLIYNGSNWLETSRSVAIA